MLNLTTPEEQLKLIKSYEEIVKEFTVVIRISPEFIFWVKPKHKKKATGEELGYSVSSSDTLDFVLQSFGLMFNAKTNYTVFKPEYLVALALVTDILEPSANMFSVLRECGDQKVQHIPVIEWSVMKGNELIASQESKLFIGSDFKLSNPASCMYSYDSNRTSPFDPFTLHQCKRTTNNRPWLFSAEKKTKNDYFIDNDPAETKPFDVVVEENKHTGICSFDGRAIDPDMRLSFFSVLADRKFVVPVFEGHQYLGSKVYFDYSSKLVKVIEPARIVSTFECEDFLFFKYGNPKYSFIGLDR